MTLDPRSLQGSMIGSRIETRKTVNSLLCGTVVCFLLSFVLDYDNVYKTKESNKQDISFLATLLIINFEIK